MVGDLVGARLDQIPSPILPWGQIRDAFPKALVLSRETGSALAYGTTPYTIYDDTSVETDARRLFRGETDGRLHFAERVIGVSRNGASVAFPFAKLSERRVMSASVGGEPVVVFWIPGARSALDQILMDEGRAVGAAAVFDPQVAGRALQFGPNVDDPATFVDRQTGSIWNIFGHAVSGELAGKRLSAIAHGTHLWFAWAAFEPGTRIAP